MVSKQCYSMKTFSSISVGFFFFVSVFFLKSEGNNRQSCLWGSHNLFNISSLSSFNFVILYLDTSLGCWLHCQVNSKVAAEITASYSVKVISTMKKTCTFVSFSLEFCYFFLSGAIRSNIAFQWYEERQ